MANRRNTLCCSYTIGAIKSTQRFHLEVSLAQSKPMFALFRPSELWSLRAILTIAQTAPPGLTATPKNYHRDNHRDDEGDKNKQIHRPTLICIG